MARKIKEYQEIVSEVMEAFGRAQVNGAKLIEENIRLAATVLFPCFHSTQKKDAKTKESVWRDELGRFHFADTVSVKNVELLVREVSNSAFGVHLRRVAHQTHVFTNRAKSSREEINSTMAHLKMRLDGRIPPPPKLPPKL